VDKSNDVPTLGILDILKVSFHVWGSDFVWATQIFYLDPVPVNSHIEISKFKNISLIGIEHKRDKPDSL